MSSNIVGRARLLNLVLLAALAAPASAFSQYLVNTGPAGTSSIIGAASLFGSGSTTCSPQPQCAAAFQRLAFRLVLPEPPRYPAWNCGLPNSVSGAAWT